MNNAAIVQSSISLLCLILFIGCEPRESKKEYLARVGDSYLTRESVEALTDSGMLSSDARLREYVHRWANTELLYQEARRQGMENSETFQQQLSDARKQYAIEALLQRELYSDTAGILEDSIRSYLENNKPDFFLRQTVVKVNMVVLASREKANSFRTQARRFSWQQAFQAMHEDTASRPMIMTVVEHRYYSQQTLFPPDLWRVALNLYPGEMSFPVRTQDGYVVIQLLAILRPGMAPELDMVRDEIRQRLLIERRRQQYADLLTRLRSKYEIDVAEQ